MGECIIARSGVGCGGNSMETVSAPPVLNISNPANATMKALESINLFVFVESNNLNCTYQWFINDIPVLGANESIYTYTPNTGTENITTYSIKCAVTNSKGTTYSRDAIITVYSTRYYIIKNYTIMDSSAKLTTPYNSSNVQVSGTMLSSSNVGNRYGELTFNESVYEYYNNKIGCTYEVNSYYNKNYPISIEAADRMNGDAIGSSGSEISISGFDVPLYISISIGSSTEGSKAYIKIKDFYLE